MSKRCLICHEKCSFWQDHVSMNGDFDIAAHHSCLFFYLATLIALEKLPNPDVISEEADKKYPLQRQLP